jgi:2-dehydro-3-deoxyphosphogluconate aldolase/(4S)-4-hydroxy-2-oxoglutarate aldolase
MPTITDLLRASRVVPVLVIDDVADAVPLAVALRDAGVSSLEITLRRVNAMDAIRRIIAEVPGVAVGAGTVTTPAQLDQLREIGVAFAVSPGMTSSMVSHARRIGLPYLPGIVTPSEIMAGLELGLAAFKFFPAAAVGGVAALRAYGDVFPQVAFCPTGGIGPDNLRDYLGLANVVAAGSSWLAPADLVRMRDWGAIGQRASTLRALAAD